QARPDLQPRALVAGPDRRRGRAHERRRARHRANQLAEGPGLERTTTRRVGRIAVGDLGDVTEAGDAQVLEQRDEKTAARFRPVRRVVAVDPEPGIDERADEPGPHRALVIGAVALAHAALVAWAIRGIARRERPQAHRREEVALDGADHRFGTIALDER